MLTVRAKRPVVRCGAFWQCAGISSDKMRDMRMLEPRQNLPFAQEPRQRGFRIHAALDQLERDSLLDLAIGTLRQPDHAHAAAAQLALDPPRADTRADEGCVDLIACLLIMRPQPGFRPRARSRRPVRSTAGSLRIQASIRRFFSARHRRRTGCAAGPDAALS